MKTFVYKLRPSHTQVALFAETLETCRRLYNHALAERKTAYTERGETLAFARQCATLPQLKQTWALRGGACPLVAPFPFRHAGAPPPQSKPGSRGIGAGSGRLARGAGRLAAAQPARTHQHGRPFAPREPDGSARA